MHRLTSEEINQYCEKYTQSETDYLKELSRQTHLRTELPIMLSGHLQGRILSMISQLINPLNILEIGTFTGYSALCLAEGLKPNGKLITIDINDEQAEISQEFFQKSGYEKQIEVMIGKASDIIPYLEYEFDLVFIDADKINYSVYFDLVFDKVKHGGYILADNVLYHGEVIDISKASKNAKAMHEYNEKISKDTRLENVLLPIRDGIMISKKK